MYGDGLIAPWIFELVASIGDVDKLNAELVRGIFKAARLVAEFCGKEQQALGWIRHAWCVPAPGLNKAVNCDNIFRERLWRTDGNQLVASRLGAAVPRFAEERDAGLRMR